MDNIQKKTAAFLLCCAFTGLHGCAYYNTFYNTQKYFNEAKKMLEKQQETERLPSNVRNSFDKTVKQASRVLQFYPESKYIDDSVMIIGQSFFYMHDYHKAERKFDELLQNFPRSDYVPQTRLWLAKTHLKLKKYDQAEVEFKMIIEKERKKSLRTEARYWLAECYYVEKKYQQAETAYKAVVKKLKDRKLRRKAFLRLGEISQELQNYTAAAEFFRGAAESSKDINAQFAAMVLYGKAYIAAKDYAKASRIFFNLIDKYFSHKEIGQAKLELGRVQYALGNIDKALEWYQVIIDDHPRTEAAVGAFLELGLYEESVRFDYEKAQEYYTKGKTHSTKGEALKEITRRLVDIKQLIALKKKIVQINAQITAIIARENGADSTAGAEETVKKKVAGIDQNKARKGVQRPRKKKPEKKLTAADLDSLHSTLNDQKIALAELFLFQYNRADSAFVQYLDILSGQGGEDYRALAFYALAYIFDKYDHKMEMRDSLYQILATNYASTSQGRAAAKHLGLPVEDEILPADILRFQSLENRLLEKRLAKKNLRDLQQFIADFPNSELLPRALHAEGWTYETYLHNPDRAYEVYKELVDKYPKSAYAKDVRRRVRGVKDKKKAEENAKKKSENSAAAEESGKTKKKSAFKKFKSEELTPPRNKTKPRNSRKTKQDTKVDI